jgi:hypothetical protein
MKPVFWNSPPSPLWHDGKSWFLDIHDKRIKTTDHLPVACGTRRPLDFEPAVEPFVRRMTAEGRLHSVTKGCFREAKLQRRLYGDELGEGKFASRP